MAEELIISTSKNKEERYQSLLPQISALIEGENDLIANLANIAAALKYGMNYFWVGFYLVRDEELVLGPFQGPVACTRIAKGKGVCGKSFQDKVTIVVDNVDEFPGHIACSSEAKSEIVVPAIKDGEVMFVLDVDSDHLADFNSIDKKYLAQLIKLVVQKS
ncbi:GAF domain-containing protein [Fulvivirgaceae bacterium BMA12]|uniref:GAF domain-containing protein n=1 Tax=Agaribacillus aureus TaxID=3051825 RepID=A0ABT8LAP3_9BACT|nr:GAF domain-containing protein [Fulvivirgaceae bacterium BMA12]